MLIHQKTLKGGYLDLIQGVRSETLYATKHGKNLGLGTTHLGKINMSRSYKIKIPISEQGYTIAKLLDDIECQELLILEQVSLSCPKCTF